MNLLMIPLLALKALRQNVLERAITNIGANLFIGVSKQGTARELARGLRFALDVEVGAAKVPLNSREN